MAGGQVVGTISIKVTPDTSKFRRELHAELAAIEKSEEAKVKVKADFDKNGLAEKVKAAAEEADARAKVKVDVNTDYLKGKIAQELSGFRTKVKVDVDVDRSFLDRLRSRGGGGGGGGLFGGGGGGGGFGGGLGSVGNFGSPANLIAIMALLPPALAILAPALASLPALISGVVAPIGAVALGMNGLKKAAEDSGLATTDKKGKLKAGPALKALTDSVSDVFAKGMTPVLQQLLTVAQPVTTAMRGIAEGLVNVASGVVKTLTSPAIVNQLNTLFANIGGLLSAAAPGFSSFTTGLVNLATQVSTHFPGLANWFNELGDKFSGWVDKISKDGSLDKAISGMRPVLDSVVGFVGKLFDAGIKLAADPQMQNSIKQTLDSITNLTTKALPDLTNFFNAIAPMIEKLVNLLPQGHTPALDPSSPFSPNHVGANGNVPHGFQPWGWNRKPGSGPGGDGNIDVAEWWMKVNGIPNPADQKQQENIFKHPFGKFGDWFGNLWAKAFEDQSKQLQDHPFGKFGDLFSTPKAGADTTPFNPGPVAPGFAQNPSGIGQAAQQAAQQAQGVSGQIKAAFDQIPQQLQGVWQAVTAGSQGAFDGLVNAAKTAVQQIIAEVGKIPGEVTKALSGLRAAGEAAGQALGQGMAAGITAGKGAAVAAAKDLASAVEGAAKVQLGVKSPSTVFASIGNYTAQGFQQGLEGGFQGVIQRATDLAGRVSEAMKSGVAAPGLAKNISDELKEIGAEYDQLKVQRDSLDPKDKAGRKSITDQMRQLQTLRDQLKLGKDRFPDSKGKSPQDMNIGQMFGQQLQKLPGIGSNFAMANINQFEQDLGISGKGAIPTIANIGIQWATSQLSKSIGSAFGNQAKPGGGNDTHIHVNSVDEAMAVKQNEQNRKALQYAGR